MSPPWTWPSVRTFGMSGKRVGRAGFRQVGREVEDGQLLKEVFVLILCRKLWPHTEKPRRSAPSRQRFCWLFQQHESWYVDFAVSECNKPDFEAWYSPKLWKPDLNKTCKTSNQFSQPQVKITVSVVQPWTCWRPVSARRTDFITTYWLVGASDRQKLISNIDDLVLGRRKPKYLLEDLRLNYRFKALLRFRCYRS